MSKERIPQCINCKHYENKTKDYGLCSSLGTPDVFRFSYNGRGLRPLVLKAGVCNQHTPAAGVIIKKDIFKTLHEE